MRTRDALRAAHALTRAERDILDAMLPSEHSGRAVLIRQAEVASVSWLDSRGQPAILLEVNPQLVPALATDGVVAEAVAADSDGVLMHLLMHVRGGYLREVEVYREDGDAVIDFPATSALSTL